MTWSDEALALGDGSPAVGGWGRAEHAVPPLEMEGGSTGGGSGEDDVPDDETQALGGWNDDATGHRATNCDCDECGNPDMSNSPSDTLCLLCVRQSVLSEAQFCADDRDDL